LARQNECELLVKTHQSKAEASCSAVSNEQAHTSFAL